MLQWPRVRGSSPVSSANQLTNVSSGPVLPLTASIRLPAPSSGPCNTPYFVPRTDADRPATNGLQRLGRWRSSSAEIRIPETEEMARPP